MVSAPNGSEDLAVVAASPAEVNLSTRSLLRGRLLHPGGVPVVELEDEGCTVTVTVEGDRASAAAQLRELAGTLLAAAEEQEPHAPPRQAHVEVTIRLGQHQLIPWCACGQPLGHPNGAYS